MYSFLKVEWLPGGMKTIQLSKGVNNMDKKIILRKIGKAVLVRIESQVEVGEKKFKGIEYEIWSDIDKMNSGIRHDEKGKSYVKTISSLTDDEPIQYFENLYNENN